jgi:hypothetical protein
LIEFPDGSRPGLHHVRDGVNRRPEVDLFLLGHSSPIIAYSTSVGGLEGHFLHSNYTVLLWPGDRRAILVVFRGGSKM